MANFLVSLTERILTYRKRYRLRKKEKRRNSSKPWLLRFLIDLLWAALFVLVINQFLVQAYVIPSGSMIPVLELRDRIFVNKFIFGPELLPGSAKIPRFRDPRRGEIVIFESPTYVSRGPVLTLLQRIIYMITFSLVNIDKDENGRPRVQLLVKRAVALGGDYVRYLDGRFMIKAAGSSEWQEESAFAARSNYAFPVQRTLQVEDIVLSEIRGQIFTRRLYEVPLSNEQEEQLRYIEARDAERRAQGMSIDIFVQEQGSVAELFALFPESELASQRYRLLQRGWYVPEGHFFPMGDNRDNSRDGRFFGPVAMEEVLGSAWYRYWPLNHAGKLQSSTR